MISMVFLLPALQIAARTPSYLERRRATGRIEQATGRAEVCEAHLSNSRPITHASRLSRLTAFAICVLPGVRSPSRSQASFARSACAIRNEDGADVPDTASCGFLHDHLRTMWRISTNHKLPRIEFAVLCRVA